MGHELRQYWAWAGGNIGAMPLEALIAAAAGLVFRKPLARLAAWVQRERTALARDALHEARTARQIAADTYRHVTGEEHPAAPAGR